MTKILLDNSKNQIMLINSLHSPNYHLWKVEDGKYPEVNETWSSNVVIDFVKNNNRKSCKTGQCEKKNW